MTKSATARSLLESIRAWRLRAGAIGPGYVALALVVPGYTTTAIDVELAQEVALAAL